MLLPTFRRRILASMLLIVAIFACTGVLFIAALSATGSIAPALVHLNYDSIEAADKMRAAWNGLQFPSYFVDRTPEERIADFDKALTFEMSNVTEPGERQVAASIGKLWNNYRRLGAVISGPEFAEMHRLLSSLVEINEKGMFARVSEAKQLSWVVLGVACIVMVAVMLGAVYLSDAFATRLAQPIKGIAAALHTRPSLDKELKLPTPSTIELRILIKEVRRLWDSLAAANKINIAEIVQQKSRLETLLSSVEDGFLVLGSDGLVTHANHLMEEILHLSSLQIIGCSWSDLSTLEENYLVLRDALKHVDDHETEVEMEIDKVKRNFALRVRRIRGSAGETIGRIVLMRDITDKRQRDRLRGEIVDLLSHELKTPIQSLGMAAEMLGQQKDKLDSRLRFFVDTINEDVVRIREVAQQFLQATQAQAKSLRLALRRVDLNEQVKEWMKPFGIIAEARNIQLKFEREGSSPVWGAVDTVKFPWAISNLLSNAIRVSPENSAVSVRISESNGRAKIEVIDGGPGVSEAVQRRMYEPFYQGPVTEGETVEPGTLGVGLTIAKEVVEGHEGRLEYVPNMPKGSIFVISIPTPPAMAI